MNIIEMRKKAKDYLKVDNVDIYKIKDSENDYEVIISKQYDYVDLTFEVLNELSEMFGTSKINIGQKSNSPGCESCDYGSEYSITLYFYNVKEFLI